MLRLILLNLRIHWVSLTFKWLCLSCAWTLYLTSHLSYAWTLHSASPFFFSLSLCPHYCEYSKFYKVSVTCVINFCLVLHQRQWNWLSLTALKQISEMSSCIFRFGIEIIVCLRRVRKYLTSCRKKVLICTLASV